MPSSLRPSLERPTSNAIRPIASLVVLVLSLTAVVARASDGVIELNQTCATQTGCAEGDDPGFPITLRAHGSYRLTGDLTVPDQNTDGIKVGADDVTIDFNGFSLFGPAFVPIGTHVCTLYGTGVGISALDSGSPASFVAQNGRIRGMGSSGIILFTSPSARIERMIVERNCDAGMMLGTAAMVLDSEARANGGLGFVVGTGSRIRDSISDNNAEGFRTDTGSVVTGCIATTNVQDGFVLGIDPFNYGSFAFGNSSVGNGYSGFRVAKGGLLLGNMITANQSDGITDSSNAFFGLNLLFETPLNAFYLNHDIACNIVNGVPHCP